MCKYRSNGTFPLSGLQSSHLNICYYHQDLHQWSLGLVLAPGFCGDLDPALLLIVSAFAPTVGHNSPSFGSRQVDLGARRPALGARSCRSSAKGKRYLPRSGRRYSTGTSTASALATISIRTGPHPESIGGSVLAIPHPTGMHGRPPSTSLSTISSTL
ncbi:hypothetical protein DH2020_003988 [Rehmannia glutinosa]|uniref:Uncharacterized protein n=1 Tax=Rehmannia glutinosa TaxID=99300 RepID=A0ABR0XN61_REHGL